MGIRPRRHQRGARRFCRSAEAAWQTGIISSEGSTFYDFVELKLPFEPVQQPYPPLWTAGNVEAAGRGGHNFIFPTAISAEMRARYDELRAESREQPGHRIRRATTPWIAQSQGVVIADTDEEAEAIARRAWRPTTETPQPDARERPGAPADGEARVGQPARQDDNVAGSDRAELLVAGIARAGA